MFILRFLRHSSMDGSTKLGEVRGAASGSRAPNRQSTVSSAMPDPGSGQTVCSSTRTQWVWVVAATGNRAPTIGQRRDSEGFAG
jgi:hypothetical protein